MKILLVCVAGMSTSLVVEKMKKALGPGDEKFVIDAEPVQRFDELVKNYDVVLLAPQARYKKAEMEKIAGQYGIPVGVINLMDYGLCEGEKILKSAKDLYKMK